ncbi:RebB family R body protein [Corallococcus exiguus]|uniref:RebB family R body protein n=1 Tax=Corallococcus exiguus TaxID=83462 RepID=UPI001A8ECFC7|nr:RebB family R body protein [Corallococcus exiguus]MBN8466723.1 RebB family R body protein [Corallococcus exiguus]
MADIVNPQITDAVTQTNVKILGESPGLAMGNLYQATAQALSLAAHNAASAQQNSSTVLQATTTQGVALLYGVDTAATAVGITDILGSNKPAYP